MYLNLNLKSDYSFFKSNVSIDHAISFAITNKLSSISLVDTNLAASYKFIEKCNENNLKPIIGLAIKINGFDYYLFANNNIGFKNLIKISTITFNKEDNEISINELKDKTSGISLIISSYDSYIAYLLNDDQIHTANEEIDNLRAIFNDIYFGVYKYQGVNNANIDAFKDFARLKGFKSIAFQYVLHVDSSDTIIINMLDCINKKIEANKNFLSDKAILNAYLKTDHEFKLTYSKDELDNLNDFVNKIGTLSYDIKFNLPELSNDPNKTIKEIAYQRLNELGLNNQKYVDRLEYELSVITKMNFSNYYLLVSDYVKYSKNNDIPVGPARGSGLSSLVAYLLNITSIDPLKYDLLFERFLNPERISYPDFDVDFADYKRNEVINYLINHYGNNHVSHIATFATYGVKGAIRDVATACKLKDDDLNYLLNSLSDDPKSINDEYKTNEKFYKLLSIHSNYKSICQIASKIENLKKQPSIHPSGMVLASEDIINNLPCFITNDDQYSIQLDYVDAEKVGLIKIDILGLKNLTLIDFMLKKINEQYNLNYNILNFPYDNDEGYKLLSKGETLGIFQLEGGGNKNSLIKKYAPSSFNDMIALLALYRPGPIENLDEFIERKHGKEYSLIDESLKDILEPTYGIIVYQEQVMQLALKVAGFSYGKAYILIKAISKKNLQSIKKLKEEFINGAIKNGFDNNKANQIYNAIEKFSNYGFNKAHSVGYSYISSLMASIKANYKTIFYLGLLLINKISGEKKNELFNEAKANNINILYPDVNKSDIYYDVGKDYIRFGLANIKSLNENIAFIIIKEREKEEFKDIYDFIIRMVINELSLESLKSLVVSGALDSLADRGKIYANIESLYNYALLFKDFDYKPNSYKDEMFKDISTPLLLFETNKNELIEQEFAELGIYIKTHPIKEIKQKYNKEITDIIDLNKDGTYNILGKIVLLEKRKYKEGKEFINVKIVDDSKDINARCYSKIDELENTLKKKDYAYLNISIKNGFAYINYFNKVEVE